MSADGTKLAATVQNGNNWISSDSGSTWTEDVSVSEEKNWRAIAMSADGTKLAATVYDGNIWKSNDNGSTWTGAAVGTGKSWSAIAMSADGTKLAATVDGGNIWTSSDGGANWTEPSSFDANKEWTSIAMSADGTKLAATGANDNIWTSSDSGNSWSETFFPEPQNWSAIAMSADGTKLAATVNGGKIWISVDSGVTWTEDTSVGANKNWTSIAMSDNGTKLAATVAGGNIWTSNNSGSTWTEDTSVGANKDWTSIAMSDNGTKLAATVNGGNIWIKTNDDWFTGSTIDIVKLAKNTYLVGGQVKKRYNEADLDLLKLKSDLVSDFEQQRDELNGKIGALSALINSLDQVDSFENNMNTVLEYMKDYDEARGKISALSTLASSLDIKFNGIDDLVDIDVAVTDAFNSFKTKYEAAVTAAGQPIEEEETSETINQKLNLISTTKTEVNNKKIEIITSHNDVLNKLQDDDLSQMANIRFIVKEFEDARISYLESYDKKTEADDVYNSLSSDHQSTVTDTIGDITVSVGAIFDKVNDIEALVKEAVDKRLDLFYNDQMTKFNDNEVKITTKFSDFTTNSLKKVLNAETLDLNDFNKLIAIDDSTLLIPSEFNTFKAISMDPSDNKFLIDVQMGQGQFVYLLYSDAVIMKYDVQNTTLDIILALKYENPQQWEERNIAGNPHRFVVNGNNIVVISASGAIWTSSDGGETWTEKQTSEEGYSMRAKNWSAITMNANGTNLAATVNGGHIFTSSDSGATWTETSVGEEKNWSAITMSANGVNLAATVADGSIWTSSDGGTNWTEDTSVGANKNWTSITSNAGKLAAIEGGNIWTSNNFGSTGWTKKTSSTSYTSVAIMDNNLVVTSTSDLTIFKHTWD